MKKTILQVSKQAHVEKPQEYITTTVAMEKTGKSKRTIINWCESGKLKAIKEKRKDGHGFVWMIPLKEAEKYAKEDEDEKVDDETTEDRQIIVDKKLTRAEAERIIKQEDAIKKQRDNLLHAGKLIDADKINDALREHYTGLLQYWEEQIDVWAVKLHLSPAQSKEMLTEYHVGLRRIWQRIRHAIEP